jgi:hypothetical protein
MWLDYLFTAAPGGGFRGFLVLVFFYVGCMVWAVLSLLWPFLAVLVVYWRCPCAGQHLLSLPPQRKISKESGFTPPAHKRVPRAATVVVHLESVFSHIPR